MIISKFTNSQLDYFRRECNFVGKERELFELRAQGKSLEECGEAMSVGRSTTGYISQRVNSKISNAIKFLDDKKRW